MELETRLLSRQVQSWVSRPGLSWHCTRPGIAHVLWLSSPGCASPGEEAGSRQALLHPGSQTIQSSDYCSDSNQCSKFTYAIIGVFLILTIITGHFLSSFLKYKWLFTLHHLSEKNLSLESFSSTLFSILGACQRTWPVTATKSKRNKNET